MQVRVGPRAQQTRRLTLQIIRLKKQHNPGSTRMEAKLGAGRWQEFLTSAGTCRKEDEVQPKRESDQCKDHEKAVRRRHPSDRKHEACRIEEAVGGGPRAAGIRRSYYAQRSDGHGEELCDGRTAQRGGHIYEQASKLCTIFFVLRVLVLVYES